MSEREARTKSRYIEQIFKYGLGYLDEDYVIAKFVVRVCISSLIFLLAQNLVKR